VGDAHRFEVLRAARDLACPVAAVFAATPALPRSPRGGGVFVFVDDAGHQCGLGLALLVQLQVGAQAFLLGERAAVAGCIGAGGRVGGPDVVLQGRPVGVEGGVVRRYACFVHASVSLRWSSGSGVAQR
jgi:hypothetical protein